MINVPPTPDHDEVDLGTAAGVTDRGLRHQRNEDAMALASEQTPDGLVVVAVVCDGVSSSRMGAEASRVAAHAALPVLLEAVRAGGDLADASRAAVVAGRESVAGLGEPENERSATTFLSAIAARGDVTLCWLGDSRAYWLAQTESDSVQLTRDDSVAGGMVEAGLATEEAAMALPHAHVLTRWLGGEAAEVLLVCSDGLWNYLPDAAELARLALPQALTDPLGAANDMVRFAIAAGGIDNITAVLIPYPAPETP
jgi:serine/threonine protein phosphatase PrpC